MTYFYRFDNSHLAPEALHFIGEQVRSLPILQGESGCIILPRGSGKTKFGMALIINTINSGVYKDIIDFKLCFVAIHNEGAKDAIQYIYDHIKHLDGLKLSLLNFTISYNGRNIVEAYSSSTFLHARGISSHNYNFIFLDEVEAYANDVVLNKAKSLLSSTRLNLLKAVPQLLLATSVSQSGQVPFRTLLAKHGIEVSE